MSGHHAHIARWRREQSLRLTAQHRPELLEQARLSGKLSRHDETFLKQLAHGSSEASSPTAPKKL
jgi:tRNA (guanine37-N1)-methyltransferase